jgi:E3 ubiquitin-protein ligase MARCH6
MKSNLSIYSIDTVNYANTLSLLHQVCLAPKHFRSTNQLVYVLVYRQDMPVVLPPTLFVQQLRKKLTFAVITALRAILVSCIWLIVLPYFTIWVWRLYFFLGANLSKNLSRLQQMKHQYGISSSSIIMNNTTASIGSNETAIGWIQDYKSRLTLQ